MTVFYRHPERSRGIWLNYYIQYRESSIQYRVLSIKNADTSEQKSNFLKNSYLTFPNRVTTICNRYSRTFFASKVQVALIIEGVFFYSLSLPEFIPGFTYTALLPGAAFFASGKKLPKSKLVLDCRSRGYRLAISQY